MIPLSLLWFSVVYFGWGLSGDSVLNHFFQGHLMATFKITDGAIKYAQSGKTDKKEWQEINAVLVNKNGKIRDSEISGFQVVKSGNKIISFRYDYRINGKRKNITLGQWPAITAGQARLLAKEKALDVANGNNPVDDKKARQVENSNTLKSYLDHEYALHMKSRAIRADRYLAMVRNNFPKIINKPLADINKTDLVKWVQYQTIQHDKGIRGYNSATIKQRYAALKTLMSHAVRNGVIERSPFDRMETLEFSKDETTNQQAKRTYLTIEQQQAFLASIDAYDEKLRAERRNSRAHGKPYLPDLDNLAFASHHKPMLLILYYMGMRMGDVVGLEWVHVIDTPFTCSISKVLEKTRRKVKTPFSLPMPEPVRNTLKQWRKQQGNPGSGLVFTSPVTNERFGAQPLVRCWNWIKKDAGFHEDLQLYTLRHNFISWLIMDNIPLSVIANMVGHSGTDMINRNYAHLIKGTADKASQNFAELLERKQM